MSTTRLTFLYPHIFRSIRARESVAKTARARTQTPRRRYPVRDFATGERQSQRLVQRHGKAVDPFLIDGDSVEALKASTTEEGGKDVDKSREYKKRTHEVQEKEARKDNTDKADSKSSTAGQLSEETQSAGRLPGDLDDGVSASKIEGGGQIQDEARPAPTLRRQSASNTTDSIAPLETVLHMPPPETQEEKNAAKPPHLQTPPYVHHFDTYTLVQQVEAGGFTTEQSITAMKAVRGLLALNLDVAKAGLVSKYDVENEAYLFRAACSELRTEVQNQRKANDESMRRDRTLLQHEVDILNQKLTQELLTLKDDLKGMFDDRKMAVRMEQRTMESKIQELNYQITVALNSDSKSEIEGLRWVLTRRSVMGILFMAIMVLASLRYASYRSHEEELKKSKEGGAKVEEIIQDLPAQSAAEVLAAN